MRLQFVTTGLVIFAAGCAGPKFVPVSGRITMGDKPLVHATIIFTPISEEKDPGPGSQGRTDAEGRFTLQVMTGNVNGALVGQHKVSITAYEGDDVVPSSGSDMKFKPAIVPDEYNAFSKLTFDVPPGGSTEANFNLPAAKK